MLNFSFCTMKLAKGFVSPPWMRWCYFLAFCQVALPIQWYPFILLEGERHSESKLSLQQPKTISSARAAWTRVQVTKQKATAPSSSWMDSQHSKGGNNTYPDDSVYLTNLTLTIFYSNHYCHCVVFQVCGFLVWWRWYTVIWHPWKRCPWTSQRNCIGEKGQVMLWTQLQQHKCNSDVWNLKINIGNLMMRYMYAPTFRL